MPRQRAKSHPLPRRFSAALSEEAYTKLRELNAEYGFGNNYLLTFLLENLDRIAKPDELERVFREKIDEFGRPSS